MKTKKMSLSLISSKLSRDEMKKIMAGSGFGSCSGQGAWCAVGGFSDCCSGYYCVNHGSGYHCCHP